MTEQMNVPKLRFAEFDGCWTNSSMRDISKINQGLQIPISERYTELKEGRYFYITNEFLRPSSTTKYYIENPSDRVICEERDILMTRTGNTGQVVTDIAGVFHNNFFKIDYSSNVDKHFLVEFLRLSTTQSMILRYAGTSTIPDLNHGDFYRIKLALPELPEQQKIASFLSKVDEKISLLTEKKDKLTEYKKGVMQQLLNGNWEERDGQLTFISPTLRFKADDGSEFPDWEEVSLGSITTTMQSGISRQLRSEDIGYPILRSNNLSEGKVSFEDVKYWYLTDDQGADLTRYILEDGDLLVNFINSLSQIGKVALYYNLIGRDAIYTTNIMRLKFKPLVTPEFAFYSFNTRRYVNFIQSIAKPAVSQASFTTVDFKKYRMHVPTRAEQDKITGFLLAIDRKIDLANSELKKAIEWKKGLLQQMFV